MSTEAAPEPSEHHLQLFDSSKSLAETISAFLYDGFERGEPLLIVATPQHRELLSKRLSSLGINLHHATMANRLVILDAVQTLEKFMRQDAPNAVAFDEVVGTLLRRISNGRRVRIYGEMVDVLVERGNYKGAYQLEQLWNTLGRRDTFTLFCGYASGHFGDPKTAKMLSDICESHDQLHRNPDDLLAEFLLKRADVRVDEERTSTPS